MSCYTTLFPPFCSLISLKFLLLICSTYAVCIAHCQQDQCINLPGDDEVEISGVCYTNTTLPSISITFGNDTLHQHKFTMNFTINVSMSVCV